MSVEVNTGEAEIEDVGVHTVRPDEKEIIIDTTVEDALDGVVEDDATPQDSPPPSPVDSAPPKEQAPRPTVVKEKAPLIAAQPPHHHKTEKKKPHRQATPPAENIFDAIDDNPQFARAMRSTLPKGPAPIEAEDWDSKASYSTEEEEELPKKKKRPIPEETQSQAEDEWDSARAYSTEGEEDEHKRDPHPSSYDSDEASSVGASEPRSQDDDQRSEASSAVTVDEEQSKEDEYIEKMKIIEQIKDYAKMGILPPQPPAFSMPISLLRKMRNYMESKADEIMGVGMIGTGWISIIGIIEKLNGQFDPFAKVFGMGLKLTGAKQAVSDKIHLYEAVFKHIYAKLPKSKEMNPWIQFGIVTMQILAEVHVKNMRDVMEHEAEETARNPQTHEDAEHVRKMFEEREKQREAERQNGTTQTPAEKKRTVPPQPKMQPPSDDLTDEDTAVPVPDPATDKVDLQQPIPKEETELKTKEEDPDEVVEEDEEVEEEDSDDDVVVQLPAPKRRGAAAQKKDDSL